MPYSAVTKLNPGEVISKTFLDGIIDNQDYLAARADGNNVAAGANQTATTTTYTQATQPSVTITPGKTGSMLIVGMIGLTHSVASGSMAARFDVSGAKTSAYILNASASAGATQTFMIFGIVSVTSGVAVTIRFEFNNLQGSGTVTHTSGATNHIYGIEVG